MRTSRYSECYSKTAPPVIWSQKDDEVAPSDVAPVLDIATFMKQRFFVSLFN